MQCTMEFTELISCILQGTYEYDDTPQASLKGLNQLITEVGYCIVLGRKESVTVNKGCSNHILGQRSGISYKSGI
jgi:hypothetical protein